MVNDENVQGWIQILKFNSRIDFPASILHLDYFDRILFIEAVINQKKGHHFAI